MPEIEFIGDWDESQAHAIAASLQKSFGVGEGGGGESLVQGLEDNPIQSLVSQRQKKLIELLRQGGSAALESADLGKSVSTSSAPVQHQCDRGCEHEWTDLSEPLIKARVGAVKRDKDGRMYQMNHNGRWQRFGGAHQYSSSTADTQFNFPYSTGEFGRGVYFDVAAAPEGWMQIRCAIYCKPSEMLTDEQFYELEQDLAQDAEVLLDMQGTKAIAQTDGDRVTRLCVRSANYIEVLGALSGSGQLPEGGDYRYRLIRLQPEEDQLTADIEIAPAAEPDGLSKAAVRSLKNPSFSGVLKGCKIQANGLPDLDRATVRAAVARCKADGVPVDSVQIRVVPGHPDFLPSCVAFCLPNENAVYLANHDPQYEISQQVRMLSHQLKTAVRAGAIAGDEALEILETAAGITPEWWLESLVKRYVGAILCARVADVMAEPNPLAWQQQYISLLAARGVEFWGTRQAIAECMAEDYRCIHDPAGLPNSVTMLWDIMNPSGARLCQEALLRVLDAAELPVLHKRANVGDRKVKDGKTYELSSSHRWKRIQEHVAQNNFGVPHNNAEPLHPDPSHNDKGIFGQKLKQLGEQVKHFAVHEGDELGRNVAAWKVGKVVGTAVANVAIAHGAPPMAAEIISETVVQAGAATAFWVAQQKNKHGTVEPRAIAAFYVQQAAAACLGKVAHHGADHMMHSFHAEEMHRQAAALVAGKSSGIGTVVAANKTSLDRKLVDAIADRGKHELGLLAQFFMGAGRSGAVYKAADGTTVPAELAELLWQLTQAGAAIALLQSQGETNDSV